MPTTSFTATSPINAIAAHFKTLTDSNGDVLGWGHPVHIDRVLGNPAKINAAGQATDIYVPQTVLTGYSQKRADNGNRWTRYGVNIAIYDFDFELAKYRAGRVAAVYDPWKGHESGAPLFTVTGWAGRLWDVENREILGSLDPTREPRLWRGVVNLMLVNLDPTF